MTNSLKGALRSITIIAAVILCLAAELAPILTPDTLTLLGIHGPTLQKAGVIWTVVMIVCRFITSGSLASKIAAATATVDPAASAAQVSQPSGASQK